MQAPADTPTPSSTLTTSPPTRTPAPNSAQRPASAAPPPPPDDGVGEPPWPPPQAERRRAARRPSLSAAGWLASTGATLLLVASVIVVASRWESIPPEARFSGLVAWLIATYFAAETGRRRYPATSQALATLAATITAPVGVAAAATLEQPWPVCVLVGGVAALAATEAQSRRWNVPTLKGATVVAFGMVAVGAAALTTAPAPLLAAIGAAAALALRATRRSVALGAAVGLSPALVVLAEFGVGEGTLRRIGVVGEVLTWSAPLSCLIAATVIGVVAQRRQHLPLAIGAASVLASGVVTGLVAGDIGAVVWWCVPAVALIVLESLGAIGSASVWRRLSAAAPVIAVPSATFGVLAPFLLVAHRVEGTSIDTGWALPLLLGGLALLATAAGSARRAGSDWLVAASLLGAAGCVVGAAAAAGAPLVVVAMAALVLWAGISASTDWRTWELTTAVVSAWGLTAVTADLSEPQWAQVVLVGLFGVAMLSAVSVVNRDDHGSRLVGAALAIGGALHLVVGGPAMIGLLTIVVMIAAGLALHPDQVLTSAGAAAAATVLAFTDAPVGWGHVAIVGALAAVYAAAADRTLHSEWAHLSAGFLVAAGALGLHVAGFESTAAALLIGVGAFALTALASLRAELLPSHTAASVAGVLAFGVSLGADPAVTSLAAALVGAQGVVLGALFRNRPLTIAGVAVLTGAAASLWWTTGANALVIDRIAPYGATGVDIVIGLTGLGLLGIGVLLRHTVRPSSWLAYGPGLGLIAAWLLSTQFEPGTGWATFGALAVGVIACGAGGVRRLGAPLVTGTAMIAATVLVSAGPRLAETPTWSWIAMGGVGLLLLAALIERSERPLLPTGDADNPSIVESFVREFE